MRTTNGKGGYTLVELLVVFAVFGILMAIMGPGFKAALAHTRTRGALNRVAVDLAYTRHLAVRSGRRARLQVEPSADCPAPRMGAAGHRYRIIVAPESVAAVVDLRLDGQPLCLATNQSAAVVFNSRGLVVGFNNRTMTVRQGNHPPASLTVSAVGRILRN